MISMQGRLEASRTVARGKQCGVPFTSKECKEFHVGFTWILRGDSGANNESEGQWSLILDLQDLWCMECGVNRQGSLRHNALGRFGDPDHDHNYPSQKY